MRKQALNHRPGFPKAATGVVSAVTRVARTPLAMMSEIASQLVIDTASCQIRMLSNVVKTTVFLKDMNEFAAMNAMYGTYFRDVPPARSTIEVARLPKDARVEIEAIAIVTKA